MSNRGSRFGFRAAPSASHFPRRPHALRPATDTIFAQRKAKPAADNSSARAPITLPIAALLVAATTLAAALIRRFAMYQLLALDMFRYNAIAVPLIAGVVALLLMSSRGIARGRALAILAVVAALCPLFAAVDGYQFTGIVMLVSGAIAFVALPVALEWIALRGAPSAVRGATLVAAAQLGGMFGNTPGLTSGPSLPAVSAVSIVLIIPIGLIAIGVRRRPEPDTRPSVAATQAVLTNYAMLGLIVVALTATAANQLLAASLPAVAMGGSATLQLVTMIELASIVALIGGGALADRFAGDQRGYARWLATTLGLAALAAFYAGRAGFVTAGYALMLAQVLPLAGVGAALALIFRIAPPAARLGALIAFFAARAIGAALMARMLAGAGSDMVFRAMGYGALLLLIAAAAIAATMPRSSRR